MIEIREDIKEFIRQNKENLTPKSLYSLIKDQIINLLEYGLIPKDIKRILEKELGIELKDRSFYYYINNLKKQEPKKLKTTQSYQKTTNKDKGTKKSFKDPFEMLKGIKS